MVILGAHFGVEGFEEMRHMRFLGRERNPGCRSGTSVALRQNKLPWSPAPGRQSLLQDLNPVGGSPTGAVLSPGAPGTTPEDTGLSHPGGRQGRDQLYRHLVEATALLLQCPEQPPHH